VDKDRDLRQVVEALDGKAPGHQPTLMIIVRLRAESAGLGADSILPSESS
jgi:hypothetical protein